MRNLLLLCLASTVLFSCGSDDKENAVLKLSKKQIEVTPEGGDYKVTVTSNEDWLVSVPVSEDWLVVSPTGAKGNSELKITVEPNPLMTERTVDVTVKSSSQLEGKVTVLQMALPLNDFLLGSWVMKSQNSGDPNYNDLVGMQILLNTDKTATVTLNIEIPGVGFLDKITGTWSLSDNNVSIVGSLMDIPVILNIAVVDTGEGVMSCQLNANLPGMFPNGGIPVVFTKK